MNEAGITEFISGFANFFGITWDIRLNLKEGARSMSIACDRIGKVHHLIIPADGNLEDTLVHSTGHEFCHAKLAEDIDTLFATMSINPRYTRGFNPTIRGIVNENIVATIGGVDFDSGTEIGRRLITGELILLPLMDIYANDLLLQKLKKNFEDRQDKYFVDFFEGRIRLNPQVHAFVTAEDVRSGRGEARGTNTSVNFSVLEQAQFPKFLEVYSDLPVLTYDRLVDLSNYEKAAQQVAKIMDWEYVPALREQENGRLAWEFEKPVEGK